jgi:hypothetical protein
MLPMAQADETKEYLMKVVRSGIAGSIGEKILSHCFLSLQWVKQGK